MYAFELKLVITSFAFPFSLLETPLISTTVGKGVIRGAVL